MLQNDQNHSKAPHGVDVLNSTATGEGLIA